MNPGLSVFIDEVVDIDVEDEEDFQSRASDIEADVESTIAQALTDHPFIENEATVKAEYVQEEA